MPDSTPTRSSSGARQLDSVERYLAAERRRTRLRLVAIALCLLAVGLSLLPLAALMTDIGHAVGFVATSLSICVGAGVVLVAGLARRRRAPTRYPRTSA